MVLHGCKVSLLGSLISCFIFVPSMMEISGLMEVSCLVFVLSMMEISGLMEVSCLVFVLSMMEVSCLVTTTADMLMARVSMNSFSSA